MNKLSCFLLIFISVNFTACGPSTTKQETTKSELKPKNIDTNKLTNQTVKQAFEAWQKGDSKDFLSFFTTNAKLYDDGNPKDFSKFVKDACSDSRY